MHIPQAKELEQKVFAITNEREFHSIALEVYKFQFENNPVYRDYCRLIKKPPEVVKVLTDIPFLPIAFFKTQRVESTSFQPELIFKSSGTTTASVSTHYVKDSRIYKKSFFKSFQNFYGNVDQYCIIGLLPSYLERGNSSLVYMVEHLIQASGHSESGFYLYELEKLNRTLQKLESGAQKTILIGVTYALLDFAEVFPQHLQNTIVMETGGMKGRKKEMTREELYQLLKTSLGVTEIHSEYGMTELMSQAYGVNGKIFCPFWMKTLFRDETDPLFIQPTSSAGSGVLNIIDLANLYSCSFIATDDLGKGFADGSFEVLGRMDNSDVRGCSLMIV